MQSRGQGGRAAPLAPLELASLDGTESLVKDAASKISASKSSRLPRVITQ